MRTETPRLLWAGAAGLGAGIVNGIFGAAGGIVLIPALAIGCRLSGDELFPTSVSIMLPVSVVSLLLSGSDLPFSSALPYLIGSALGGVLAGLWGRQIPTLWLHRLFGVMILWGGLRYLW